MSASSRAPQLWASLWRGHWAAPAGGSSQAGGAQGPTSPADWTGDLPAAQAGTGRDWGQEEKGTTEDEMVGWNHRLNGHELEQNPGDSEGQGRLRALGGKNHCPCNFTETKETV